MMSCSKLNCSKSKTYKIWKTSNNFKNRQIERKYRFLS